MTSETPPLKRLKELLHSLSEEQGTGLVNVIQSIDAWLQEHRNGLEPQLAHFLARRSYDKAMQYLQVYK